MDGRDSDLCETTTCGKKQLSSFRESDFKSHVLGAVDVFLLFVFVVFGLVCGFLFEMRILVVVLSMWRNWFSAFVSASLSAGPFAVFGFCFVVARTLVNRVLRFT